MNNVTLKGGAARIYPYKPEGYRRHLLGTADFVIAQVRDCNEDYILNNIPISLKGEVQTAFVLEKLEGFDPRKGDASGRSLRYIIEFIDEHGYLWQLNRCKVVDVAFELCIGPKPTLRVEGVADALYAIIVNR